LNNLGGERHVCTREHGQSNDVHIFVNSHCSNHLWSLKKPRVHNFKTGIAKNSRNNFYASIMAVQTDFGN
jgi:hypothetical protein